MSKNFGKYIVEFIGTFFLVLVIGCSATLSSTSFINAIAIGFTLMVMVYAGGYISGGHYNPAVSLSATIRKALPVKQLMPYMIAQFAGGIIAAICVNYFADGPSIPSLTGYYLPLMILAEFLFTFALCYVVLFTATDEQTQGNSYFGLAIGSTVTAGACAVGGTICMGAFNPVVALCATIMSSCCIKIAIITILANLAGGLAAALVYRIIKEQT